MRGIIKQILYASRRDSLFFGTTFLIICCTALSSFLGSNALVEAQSMKIVYTAGVSRITLMLGFIIFIMFYIKRLFDNHEIEVILAHPISRMKVLFGLTIGFALILSFLVLPVFVILLFMGAGFKNALVWILSIYAEGLIMLSFTTCVALIIKSVVHGLFASMALYFMGRVIGSFVSYIQFDFSFEFTKLTGNILKAISVCIPRLDLFGKTKWLLYGDYNLSTIWLFASQALVFTAIFVCIAIIDLRKKEF